MGHSLSDHSNSPVRNRRSSNRKSRSPSQRERSRARHKSSHRDSSPVREKHSGHAKSLKQEMSRSPSPPARYTNTQKDSSPRSKEKSSSRLRHEKSCSPSPRTKRLRRAQAEREDELVAERDRQRNHGKGDDKGSRKERETEKFSDRDHVRSGKGSDKGTHREREFEKMKGREKDRKNGRGSENNVHRERGADRENGADRKERRSGRDIADEKSSRARDERSASPSDSHHRSRHRSRSPRRDVDRREHDEVTNTRGIENGEEGDDSLARMKAAEEALEAKQKNQPSFELSGKLAAETNRFRGVTLLFNEPPEACKPDIRWRLYIFKAGEMLNEPLYIHRQSCYLFGRERRVADIPTDHPSCSKQHAVVQFRKVEKEQPDGSLSKQVRPYIMDLGSTNKTFINDNPIEPQRYYELFEKDTIKFGNSSREYVLLHENSAS